jgi:hypothetical protein
MRGGILRPSNWLARVRNDGLFIQFRSYLNYHLPADALTVFFIPYQEIRSARLVRERTKIRTTMGFLHRPDAWWSLNWLI